MARTTRLALALAVLLVVGTAAPGVAGQDGTVATDRGDGADRTIATATEQDGTPTGQDDGTVAIETDGFDPDYDPARVLSRVEELRGLPATQGITLHEYDADADTTYDVRDEFGAIRPVGAQTLQLYSNASTENRQPLGYTVERQAAVHIYLLNATDLREYGVSQQAVLAHEFVHALQFQHDLLSPSRAELRSRFGRWTTDSRLVTTALVEGDAMWVTEQYVRRYGDSDYSVTRYNRSLARAAWPHSVAGTPYYYGYEFYAAVGRAPENRSALVRRPPNSTAELLHPTERVERAPLPEPPSIPDAENLTRYHADTVGELMVRHALRVNGLSFSRAAAVGDGWANGRMYYYAAEGAKGPATHWVTVWASASEAREFVEGWRSMLDALGARSVAGTLVVPATDHAPGFNYVVERDGATVRVTAADRREIAERLAEAAGANASVGTTGPNAGVGTTESNASAER